MKTQIVKLTYGSAQYKVIFDDEAKVNPYKIYKFWRISGDLKGWMDRDWMRIKQRQKLVISYDDLASCLYYLFDVVKNGKPALSETESIMETLNRR